MDCPNDVKSLLMTHMGVVHRQVTEVRDENIGKGCFFHDRRKNIFRRVRKKSSRFPESDGLPLNPFQDIRFTA